MSAGWQTISILHDGAHPHPSVHYSCTHHANSLFPGADPRKTLGRPSHAHKFFRELAPEKISGPNGKTASHAGHGSPAHAENVGESRIKAIDSHSHKHNSNRTDQYFLPPQSQHGWYKQVDGPKSYIFLG